MKTQSDLHLYLLKKVHGWCRRQGMTDPRNVFPSMEGCTSFCNRERFQQKNRKMKQEESRELGNLSMNIHSMQSHLNSTGNSREGIPSIHSKDPAGIIC